MKNEIAAHIMKFVKMGANIKIGKSVFIVLSIITTFFVSAYSLAQQTENNSTSLFNIAPITISESFLYPEEIRRFSALREVIDILGQERLISTIMFKLRYGKETKTLDAFQRMEQASNELKFQADKNAYNAAERDALLATLYHNDNMYSKIIFKVDDDPIYKANFVPNGFHDVLLLKNKFFGDKIVLLSSDGYIEIRITGSNDQAIDDAANNQFQTTATNRIISIVVVAYEEQITPVLFFDKNGTLRELTYLYYDYPFEFYDVQSENDPDVLASMKNKNELDYYVYYFSDTLPTKPRYTDRRLIWDENGRLVKFSSFRQNEEHDISDVFYSSEENYFVTHRRPVSCLNTPLFDSSVESLNKTNGFTEEEELVFSKVRATLTALNNLRDVYSIEDCLLEKNDGLLCRDIDDNNLVDVKFFSLCGLNNHVYFNLGDAEKILSIGIAESNANSLNSTSSDTNVTKNALSFIRVYIKSKLSQIDYEYNEVTNKLIRVASTIYKDVDSKSFYKSYQHGCCRFTTSNPKYKDEILQRFVMPCGRALLHIVSFNDNEEYEDAYYDPPKPY